MTHWYEDNSRSIGHTPLVKLNRVTDGAPATVLAKIEGRNPAYSVKCRIGAAMVWDAEKRGLLGPGKELVEPTSGNTGIALAFVAAARGIPLTLTMPETMSVERRKLLVAYGAKLVLTEGAQRHAGRDREGGRNRRVGSRPAMCCCSSSRIRPIRPFMKPPPAPKSGTIPMARSTSSSRASAPAAPSPASPATSKNTEGKAIKSVAVEPSASPVLTQTRAGEPLKPGPHKIQGIGAGFVPDVLDLGLVDSVEQVSNEEAIEYARRLAREEGILAGHILRGRDRRRRAPGQAARECRQDHRGDSARLRRTLPQHSLVRGAVRCARDSPPDWRNSRGHCFRPAHSSRYCPGRRGVAGVTGALTRKPKREIHPPKLPSRTVLKEVIDGLAAVLFPNRLGAGDLNDEGIDYFVGHTLDANLHRLQEQIQRELRFKAEQDGNFIRTARKSSPSILNRPPVRGDAAEKPRVAGQRSPRRLRGRSGCPQHR